MESRSIPMSAGRDLSAMFESAEATDVVGHHRGSMWISGLLEGRCIITEKGVQCVNVSLNRNREVTAAMRTLNVGTGAVKPSTSSPSSATLSAWETSGDFPTWPTGMEEVCVWS